MNVCHPKKHTQMVPSFESFVSNDELIGETKGPEEERMYDRRDGTPSKR